MAHQGYGFCEFLTEEDAEYACKIMNQIKLWGKPIRVNKVGILSSRQILWKRGVLTAFDSVTSLSLPPPSMSTPIIVAADPTYYHE
jgi:RNA recognition motif-containing protein